MSIYTELLEVRMDDIKYRALPLVIAIAIVTVGILIYYSRLSNGCWVLTVVPDFDRKAIVKQDACEIILRSDLGNFEDAFRYPR